MSNSILGLCCLCASISLSVQQGNFQQQVVDPIFETSVKTLHATAYIVSPGENVFGRVMFSQDFTSGAPTRIFGNISGLLPGKHGLAIGTWGNLTDGCRSVGSHFNPDFMDHGGKDATNRHVGDLGNVNNLSNNVNVVDQKVTLFGRNSVMGRAVVVHEREDDFGLGDSQQSLINGNAGAVVACGVIGKMPHERNDI